MTGKGTFHKSCHCKSCNRGRNRLARNLNERKLRRMSRDQIIKFLKGAEDVLIAPISSPYTD